MSLMQVLFMIISKHTPLSGHQGCLAPTGIKRLFHASSRLQHSNDQPLLGVVNLWMDLLRQGARHRNGQVASSAIKYPGHLGAASDEDEQQQRWAAADLLLKEQLRAFQGRIDGELMPEQVHRDLMKFYQQLQPSERTPFLQLLTTRLGIQEVEIARAVSMWNTYVASSNRTANTAAAQQPGAESAATASNQHPPATSQPGNGAVAGNIVNAPGATGGKRWIAGQRNGRQPSLSPTLPQAPSQTGQPSTDYSLSAATTAAGGVPLSGEALLRAAERLRIAALPLYTQLFAPISREPDGIPFLVALRAHAREALSEQPSLGPALRALDTHLKQALSGWFTPGLLQCRQLTWDTATGQLLQKIMQYEAVHPMSDWEDLKRRLGPERRVHAYFHPCLPEEPLVILHAALTHSVPSTMEQVLPHDYPHTASAWHAGKTPAYGSNMNGNHTASMQPSPMPNPRASPPARGSPDHGLCAPPGRAGRAASYNGNGAAMQHEVDQEPTVAAFYSISSTQPGLAGVDLGHFLISDVAKKVQAELPSITCLVTLSPLPGFKSWLQSHLAAAAMQQGSKMMGTASRQGSPMPGSPMNNGNGFHMHATGSWEQTGRPGSPAHHASLNSNSNIKGQLSDEDIPALLQQQPDLFMDLRPETLPSPPIMFEHEAQQLLTAAPRILNSVDMAKLAAAGNSPAAALALILESGKWVDVNTVSKDFDDMLQRLMARAAARYLALERRRNLALDPVGHFHLRNGARLLRVNTRCDMSETGLDKAYGVMVNYSYDLKEAYINNQKYLVNHEVRTSRLVTQLLTN